MAVACSATGRGPGPPANKRMPASAAIRGMMTTCCGRRLDRMDPQLSLKSRSWSGPTRASTEGSECIFGSWGKPDKGSGVPPQGDSDARTTRRLRSRRRAGPSRGDRPSAALAERLDFVSTASASTRPARPDAKRRAESPFARESLRCVQITDSSSVNPPPYARYGWRGSCFS